MYRHCNGCYRHAIRYRVECRRPEKRRCLGRCPVGSLRTCSQTGHECARGDYTADDGNQAGFPTIALQRFHLRERVTRCHSGREAISGSRSDRGVVRFRRHDCVFGRDVIGHGAGLTQNAKQFPRSAVGQLFSHHFTPADQSRGKFCSVASLAGGAA